MSNKILITDSLFFFSEHVERLKAAGFDVERLDKPIATEEELISAVKGKVGYLLGGIEQITPKVLDAADQLKVISFTGIDFKAAISSWEYATQKGIAITNTPDGPTNEVAEWALTAALVMNRHFFELGRANNDKKFILTPGLEAQKVGIVGLGRIGSRIAEMLPVFRPAKVSYYSKHRHQDKEGELNIDFHDLPDVLANSDIIFLCVDGSEKDFFSTDQFKHMRHDSLLVSFMHDGVINEDALFSALEEDSIRAISDHPMSEKFNKFSLDRWYCMNTSSTITNAGAKLISDTATESAINILMTGDDKYLANPGYKKFLRN